MNGFERIGFILSIRNLCLAPMGFSCPFFNSYAAAQRFCSSDGFFLFPYLVDKVITEDQRYTNGIGILKESCLLELRVLRCHDQLQCIDEFNSIILRYSTLPFEA